MLGSIGRGIVGTVAIIEAIEAALLIVIGLGVARAFDI